MRHDDSPPTQLSSNGHPLDAAVDDFNAWLDALVTGSEGRLCPIPSTPTWDGARIGAQEIHALTSREDWHQASEAVMERTWASIMTETLTRDAASSAAAGAFTMPERGAVKQDRRHRIAPPWNPHAELGSRWWRRILRWQPAISTAGTLVLLFALIAGYAGSRGTLPLGRDGDGRSQLAAIGTPLVQASPSPVSVACDADVEDVREVDRIRASAPTWPAPEYTPVRRADAETVTAVRTVYERFLACSSPHGIFSSHEYATDRYVWSTSPSNPLSETMNRIINEFIVDDGRAREEFTTAAWWSTPQTDSAGSAQSLQAGTVFVLSDGRVAGLSGDLTMPHEYEQLVSGLPHGIYWYVAFAQEDGQWLVDESVGVGIGQGI